MITKFIFIVVGVIAAVLLFAATRPDTFQVQREITIKAPAEKIAPLISDFHNWGSWSPWEKLDPGMKKTFSGPSSGKGTVYEWDGNKQVGAGRMEITDMTPNAKIEIKLDFLRPFEGHNVTDFILEPAGDSTKVIWNMHGPSPYLSKVMGIFVSMDSMIGKDFEAGLGTLKVLAEK